MFNSVFQYQSINFCFISTTNPTKVNKFCILFFNIFNYEIEIHVPFISPITFCDLNAPFFVLLQNRKIVINVTVTPNID